MTDQILTEPLCLDDVHGARITITGKLLGTKLLYPKWGGRRLHQLKWLVEDDRGFKVYVSAPTLRDDDYDKLHVISDTSDGWRGLKFKFDCEIKATNDARFCLGLRPTKASYLPTNS